MIIIAVAVMFLLAFIAGMFLTLITRNIARTSRGGDVVQAQYLAEAGIRYANDQLTHSMLGADWRPDPVNPNEIPIGDPDAEWLKAGYTRFNQGNGRFLLRVSYQPVKVDEKGAPLDADGNPTDDRARMIYPDLGKYIKIESIGRRGVVDPNDPTTWGNADPLRRQLVAYKPIGITDYARYVTNKDRSEDTMVLGSFPFAYPQGSGNAANFRTDIYGPVRVNGDLMWAGTDQVILNAAEKPGATPKQQYAPTLENHLSGVNRNDAVAVAGRIFHDAWPFGSAPSDQVTLLNMNQTSPAPVNLAPSKSDDFTTVQGLYRDAAPGVTAAGKMRAVARLEPPAMDQEEASTGILRYRLLTRDTGVVLPGKNANTGRYGLGMGIYVDNANERQRDNQYRRLTDEWMRTGTGSESSIAPDSAWRQNLYIPPGAEVYLDPTPNRLLNSALPANQSVGTIIITRHDGKQWRNEEGTEEGYTRRYRYPLRRVFDDTGKMLATETYGTGGDDFRDDSGVYKTFQNGVIFMEGNLRLQGQLPPDWAGKTPDGDRVVGQNLTFVTMGTAYIEGNLLKGQAADGNINKFGQGLQVGSITVIARDYVCVNTTAYFMKQPSSGAWNFALGNPYTELASANDQFSTSGYSAVDPSLYPANARGNKQEMFFLQTAESYSGAAAQLRLYNALDQAMNPFGGDNPMVVTPGQYSPETSAEAFWQHFALPLVGNSTGANRTSWGLGVGPLPDWMSLTYRPWAGLMPGNAGPGWYVPDYTVAYNRPYWLSRVATSPMDIRIEAVLYAQNGSFFVIPGEWMNTDANDQRGPTALGSLRYNDPVRAGWRKEDLAAGRSAWPFYAEPPDIRVVIDGAIAENLPADKDYQTAWAKHWGWTPATRPDGTESAHKGEGLVYLYDNDLRIPLRYDKFNRPLPPMPALPVSPDLVFFGEAS